MEVLDQLDIATWQASSADPSTSHAADALEDGRILFAPHLSFQLSDNERKFLSLDCLDNQSKNVSFRPDTGAVHGTQCQGAELEGLRGMLSRFHQHSRAWITTICPGYRDHLTDGFTTYRPADIAHRVLSWRKDDTRLHVDAFPSRPLQGRRILRVFSNVNPNIPRVWRVGEHFENVAARFLPDLRPPVPGLSWLLQLVRIVKGERTAYDHYMLSLHDRMKADTDYQTHAAQTKLALPPGSTWACFTDLVPHAAMSGQFAFEQTFYLPVEAMQDPAKSPLRILERLTGRLLL
jgi:hypothetical protein